MGVEFELEQSIAILERTPRVLRAWLAGLSRAWTHGDYGPGTFSPYDVVGHLIHGEKTDWLPRARLILEHGTSRPFEPFDRYAMFEESRGRPLEALLDEFEGLRAANLDALRGLGLSPDPLARRGLHPALGEVTLGELLATWVAHDLNHLAQIAKAMAWRYEREVGPWRAYMSILQPPAAAMDEAGEARAAAARQRGDR